MMKKFLIGTLVLTMLMTGCAQSKSTASSGAEKQAPVQVTETTESNVTSEEIMERVDTSSTAESVAIPANFPISYVPIIDGAQIIKGESKDEADKTIFDITQSVNLVPADAYNYYKEIYADAPSYALSNEKEGEAMTVAREKNGVTATLQFAADGDGKSQVIIHAEVLK